MSIAPPITSAPATLDDLLKVDGKAELIGGRIVQLMPSGHAPTRAAFKIAMSLEVWSAKTGTGIVYTDGIGFAIRPPLRSGRQSFSPDASLYVGPPPRSPMRFVEGAPRFAVEVRSEGDYTRAAEREMEQKRADYFEAGTQVVWDVDPQAQVVHAFSADAPSVPITFSCGQFANAEPAIRGWQIAVSEIFS